MPLTKRTQEPFGYIRRTVPTTPIVREGISETAKRTQEPLGHIDGPFGK